MSDFKIVSKGAKVDPCYGLYNFYITKEEIAALLSGKKLYSTVSCDEYAITIEMEEKEACIDCDFFSDSEYYADNTVTACAVSWGSCTKCQRNITSTSPHTEVPSWCPLKGDKDE